MARVVVAPVNPVVASDQEGRKRLRRTMAGLQPKFGGWGGARLTGSSGPWWHVRAEGT
jgi:hypothetical protein